MNKKLIIALIIILLLILAILLYVRNENRGEKDTGLNIVTIWEAETVPGDKSTLDFSNTMQTIQSERKGFLRGMQDCPAAVSIHENMVSENMNMVDFANNLADMYNSKDILMAVGASTEAVTMYSAMSANFFRIPMVIPFVSGDLDVSGTGTGIFRMTPTGDQYAEFVKDYIAPNDLRSQVSALLFEDGPVRDFEIAAGVFFANNFNGHDSAVKITQTLMDNGYNIEYYLPYEEDGLMTAAATAWKTDETRLSGLDVVFLIGKDQDDFSELMDFVSLWDGIDPETLFVVIGYIPEIDMPELYRADNVYMIEQDLDLSQCPADITTNGEAMAYAAGYITTLTLDRALRDKPKEENPLITFFRSEDGKHNKRQEYLEARRNNVQLKLREINEHIPCYGELHFGSGSETNVRLELVRYTAQDRTEKVDSYEILNRIYSNLQRAYGGGY